MKTNKVIKAMRTVKTKVIFRQKNGRSFVTAAGITYEGSCIVDATHEAVIGLLRIAEMMDLAHEFVGELPKNTEDIDELGCCCEDECEDCSELELCPACAEELRIQMEEECVDEESESCDSTCLVEDIPDSVAAENDNNDECAV